MIWSQHRCQCLPLGTRKPLSPRAPHWPTKPLSEHTDPRSSCNACISVHTTRIIKQWSHSHSQGHTLIWSHRSMWGLLSNVTPAGSHTQEGHLAGRSLPVHALYTQPVSIMSPRGFLDLTSRQPFSKNVVTLLPGPLISLLLPTSTFCPFLRPSAHQPHPSPLPATGLEVRGWSRRDWHNGDCVGPTQQSCLLPHKHG